MALMSLFASQLAAPGTGPSPLLTGLISCYNLENTADSAGSNTLTNNNVVTFVPGKVINGANFVAASSQYLSVADQVWGIANTWSFAFWFYSTTGNHNEGLFQLGASGAAPSINLIKSDTDYVYVVNSGGGTGAFISGLSVPVATWTHRVITCDGTTIYVWTDGVSDGGTALSGSLTNTSRPLWVGTDSNNGVTPLENFGGIMDVLVVYDRALDATDVGLLYNAGAGRQAPF